MTKHIRYFAALLIVLSCSNTALNDPGKICRTKSGWESYGLKGKVKNLKETHYEISNDLADSAYKNRFSYKKRIDFDSKGKTIEINEWKRENYSFKEIHAYDTLGNLAKIEYYEGSSKTPSTKTVFKYDAYGNKAEDVQYNHDNSFNSRTAYFNDFESSSIEYKRMDINRNLISKEIKKYNEQGLEIVYEAYDSKENLSSIHKYSYDKSGNITTDLYDFVEIGSKMEYKYKYNDQGYLIEQTDFSDENEIIKFEYEAFDEFKNWTKTVVFRKGRPFTIVEREYIYY